MERQEQHIRDLLQRWTTGDLTAREEAELLAAAEHDTFLREALAAYRGLPAHDHAANLARLRSKTAIRKPAKIRSITRWAAVAASLLLLLTIGWWALDQQSGLDLTPVAMSENEAAFEEVTKQPAPVNRDISAGDRSSEEETLERSDDQVPTTLSEEINNDDAALADKRQRKTVRVEESSTAEVAAADQNKLIALEDATLGAENSSAPASFSLPDTQAFTLQPKETEADNWVLAPPPPSPSPPAAAPSSAYPTQSQPYSRILKDQTLSTNSGVRVPLKGYRIVSGYVRDTEGYPLIGASILEATSVSGTVSDIDGYFSLSIPVATQTLTVSYTGFETTEVEVAANGNLEVVLPESQATLDEVVVTGLGNNQQETEEVIATARPDGGFRALRKYIEANTPDNVPKARVKLSFVVLADGEITDIRVLKSTNAGQNALAIQLLEDGPSWEITAGTAPVEVVYMVRF